MTPEPTSTPFKLGTFSVAGCTPFAGVVIGERVVAATALQALCARLGQPLNAPATVLGLLEAWESNFPALVAAVGELERQPEPPEFIDLQAVKVHPPVLLPRQILCAGANYYQHVIDLIVDQGSPDTAGMGPEERRAYATRLMNERAATGSPYVFVKLPSAVTGPYDPIVIPETSTQADWEIELGVIIGKPTHRVSRAEALGHVAGYTIVNDVTSRDKIYRQDFRAMGTDWFLSKCSPGFLPVGPYLVPAAFVPNPQALHLTLKLNGEVMQDEETSDMIFDVARLIEYISRHVRLWPGDLICTGSPQGNGTHYHRYLRPDDVLEGSIGGFGMQRNPCVAEGS